MKHTGNTSCTVGGGGFTHAKTNNKHFNNKHFNHELDHKLIHKH